jgi:rhodanese-related sulfurtransferase
MITSLSRLRRSRRAPAWIEACDLAKRVNIDTAVLVLDVCAVPTNLCDRLVIYRGSEPTLNELPGHLIQLVDDSRPIVVVCKTDRRSSMAAERLREAGSSNVSVLRGGMEQWRALGLPVA